MDIITNKPKLPMQQLKDSMLDSVSGGNPALLLAALGFVYYERHDIADFFTGFYEGVAEGRTK